MRLLIDLLPWIFLAALALPAIGVPVCAAIGDDQADRTAARLTLAGSSVAAGCVAVMLAVMALT